MRIRYLSLAVVDLAEIRSYMATNHPELAQSVGEKLRDSLNGLVQFPSLGKPGRVFGTRELIIPKVGKLTYIAIYRVVHEEVQILRIVAGMRDIDSLLADGFGDEDD
jgi:toxin ParE1/3/4